MSKDLPVLPPMDRRNALKIMAAAAATPAVLASCQPAIDRTGTAGAGQATGNVRAAGTAADPDLVSPVVPWDLTLTADELESLAALCDVIIPADDRSPSASQVGAHQYIDEWVSAPYDRMRRDKVLIRGGLLWLDAEAIRRFGEGPRFRDVSLERKHAICDDICYRPEAAPEFRAAARFFDKVRDLTAGAFFTTEEGMRDLPYIGNTPLERWDPPPAEVLRHLGLE